MRVFKPKTSYLKIRKIRWLVYCGIFKIRGGQFPLIAQILQVRGDVILCNLLYLQKEIKLYYPNLLTRVGCLFVD